MLLELLEKTFADRCRKNPQYSLRAYARSLGMDSSTLSALLRRKRPLTPKTARRLVDKLGVASPVQARTLLLSVMGSQAEAAAAEYGELDLEVAEMISSWEHFAILAYLETGCEKRDVRTLSRRLRLATGVVIECLRRMQRIGLVSEENDKWSVKSRNFSTPTNISSAALREANRQLVNLALEAMEREPVERRDVTGITMAVNSKRFKEAQGMIRDFRRRLSDFLEEGERDQVYRLNIQLFPLTGEETR